MKIFISHNTQDQHLLNAIKSISLSIGIEPLIAENIVDISKPITAKIENMILQSDLVIVMLTRGGFNSNFVQQEIGFAKNKRDMLILVEKGCEKNISGFIHGCDYVSIDPWNPQPAYMKVNQILTSYKKKKEQRDAIGQLILLSLGIFFFTSGSGNRR